jgi:hypothetical protein
MTDDEATRTARALTRIYINDHRAGAAGGLALARRSEHNNRGSTLGDALATIVRELAADELILTAIADRLSISNDPIKRLLGRAGELFGRLKANGRLREYSPLSRVVELEMLLAGIDAKRSLWRSLGATRATTLPEFDFSELEERATQQRGLLVPFHRTAAQVAFASATPTMDLAPEATR